LDSGSWKLEAGSYMLPTLLSRRDRTELSLLAGGLLVVLGLLLFAELADMVREGQTQRFDERILRSLRRADDPSTPIGPSWLRGAALDITALGSAAVLGLAVAGIVGFLLLQGLRRTALFVFVASAGGWMLNGALKELFQRARPDVVPHLREVLTLSFPSGHAMTSAAVYLTLGAMLMRIAERRATKVYCMGVAMLVTLLVGASRVFLGVHYPTDVLAGWLVGLSWAVVCWLIERAIEHRSGMKREQQQAS
jgi:undecaprenyl-diphosphatase